MLSSRGRRVASRVFLRALLARFRVLGRPVAKFGSPRRTERGQSGHLGGGNAQAGGERRQFRDKLPCHEPTIGVRGGNEVRLLHVLISCVCGGYAVFWQWPADVPLTPTEPPLVRGKLPLGPVTLPFGPPGVRLDPVRVPLEPTAPSLAPVEARRVPGEVSLVPAGPSLGLAETSLASVIGCRASRACSDQRPG